MEIIQTKEHWGLSVFEVVDNDGRAIAQCWRGSGEQNLADAERIAAMWDALRGFTTAEIKAGLDLAAIHSELTATKLLLQVETARADKAEQQLDSLLAAIDKLRKVKGRYHTEQVYNELIALADVMKRGGENAEK